MRGNVYPPSMDVHSVGEIHGYLGGTGGICTATPPSTSTLHPWTYIV